MPLGRRAGHWPGNRPPKPLPRSPSQLRCPGFIVGYTGGSQNPNWCLPEGNFLNLLDRRLNVEVRGLFWGAGNSRGDDLGLARCFGVKRPPGGTAPLPHFSMAANVAAPRPLSSEGAAQVADDPLHEVYHVTKVFLGSGVDGGVCRGFHRGSGEAHALKYVSRNSYCTHEHRELAILQLFQKHPHPNVLTLLADFAPIGSDRPQWVLATPEAECNLRTFMWRHHNERPKITRSFGRQILEGLSHIHYHRVLHRDLKPDNILVLFDLHAPAPSPECVDTSWAMRVQLADFSRARVLPEDGFARTRVRKKTIERPAIGVMSVMVCTRNYSAPELIADDADATRSYGAAVDLWSFGCIFFELLTGELFAPGKTFLEIAAWWQLRLEHPLPEAIAIE